MVIMQKLNRQIRVPDSDIDYAKAKGYAIVKPETETGISMGKTDDDDNTDGIVELDERETPEAALAASGKRSRTTASE